MEQVTCVNLVERVRTLESALRSTDNTTEVHYDLIDMLSDIANKDISVWLESAGTIEIQCHLIRCLYYSINIGTTEEQLNATKLIQRELLAMRHTINQIIADYATIDENKCS